MKRLFIFLSLALAFFSANTQTPKVPQWLGAPNTALSVRGDLAIDSAFGLPIRDTNFIPKYPPPSTLNRPGVMIIRPQDWTVYIFDTVGTPDHWSQLKSPEETLTGDLGIRQRKVGTVITTENKGRAFAAVSDMRTYTGDIYRDWVFRVSDVTGVRDYRVDTLDTTTPDDGVLTIVNTAAGRASNHARLKLQFSGPLDARWYGTDYRSTNNQPALLAAVTAASTAPVKTVLISGGAYALTSNLTIPAGVVLRIAPGSTLTGAVTITGGIIDAGYREQLFTPNLTIHPEACLGGMFSMQWYGASPTQTATNNAITLQKAIDVCVYQNAIHHIFWPGGNYSVDKGLIFYKDDNADGIREFITGFYLEGETVAYGGGGTEVTLTVTNGNSFGIDLQQVKGFKIENIGAIGHNTALASGNIYKYCEDPTYDWINGNRANWSSPHAGFVVDGIATSTTPSGDRYPDFTAFYTDPASGGSTDIVFRNCLARYWIVGFAMSPHGSPQNGDIISVNDCWADYCKAAISTGQSQNRSVFVNNFKCWGGTETVFDCTNFSDGTGNPPEVDGVNIAGGVRYLCRLGNWASIGLTIRRMHAELLGSFGGNWAGTNGNLTIYDSWITPTGSMQLNPGTHPTATFFQGSNLNMVNCFLSYYSSGASPMGFSVKQGNFVRCAFDALPIGHGLSQMAFDHCSGGGGFFQWGTGVVITSFVVPNVGVIPFTSGMTFIPDQPSYDQFFSSTKRIKVERAKGAGGWGDKNYQLIYEGNRAVSNLDASTLKADITLPVGGADIKKLQVFDFLLTTTTDEFGNAGVFVTIGRVESINTGTGVVRIESTMKGLTATNYDIFLYRPATMLTAFVTGNSTVGTNTVTGILIEQSVTTIPVGLTINSPYFPEGTWVTGYNSGTKVLTLSNDATATATNIDIISSEWQGITYGKFRDDSPYEIGYKKGDVIWNARPDDATVKDILYWIVTKSGITSSTRLPEARAYYKDLVPQLVDNTAADAATVTFYYNTTSSVHRIKNGGTWLDIPTWDANTLIYNQGGDIEFRTGNGTPSAKVLASQQLVAYRGIAYQSNQIITTAGATTIGNNIITVYVDPASVLATATITLPASPVDGQEIRFMFGGTITAGNPVVTTLSIVANTGQTMLSVSPGSATSNDLLIYQYRASNTKWYRAN